MPVNLERIQRDMDVFAAMGRSSERPGLSRLAMTAEDAQGRRYCLQLMRAAGLAVQIDAVGNILGLTPAAWREPGRAVVMGSHLDTVPSGGAFDGVTGVIGGLEAIRSLAETGGELPPLGVAVFSCEESSRFRVATIGSKVLAGFLALEQALELKDAAGVTYGEAVRAHGGWDEVGGPQPWPRFGAYLELHVEQGRELEISGQKVAAVQRCAAPHRLRITIKGEAAHSGATPLFRRKDALVAAAEVILAVERIAETEAENGTVGTTTVFEVAPVAINVVPGTVSLGVDLRGVETSSKERAMRKLQDFCHRLAAMREVGITFDVLGSEDPVTLAPQVVEAVVGACADLGLPPLRMDSRAGHDAMYIQRLCPSGMVFVPSTGGISHHPNEHTDMADIALGTRVLCQAALRLQKGL